MKTLGLSIGIGQHWSDAATYACTQMQKHTGIECRPIHDIPGLPAGWNPSWGKAWLWDFVPDEVERILFFDCDIVCIRPWTEWQIAHPYLATREIYRNPVINAEIRAYGLQDYFNSGLFVCHRSQRQRLESIRDYGPHYSAWIDQTAMNVVFADTWRPMPSHTNWLLMAETNRLVGALDARASCIHLAGRKQLDELVPMMEKIVHLAHG